MRIFIRHMLENYGTDPLVTKLMQTSRVHVMPTMNPDGYEDSTEGQCKGSTGRSVSYGYKDSK